MMSSYVTPNLGWGSALGVSWSLHCLGAHSAVGAAVPGDRLQGDARREMH